MIYRLVMVAIVTTIITSLVPISPALAQTCEYWVAPAPEGSNGSPGTFTQPWATLDYASARVLALGRNNYTV